MSNSRGSLFFGSPVIRDYFDDIFADSAWRDFDRVFSAFAGSIQSFPPYNVYALKNGSVKVDFALAGYREDEISLQAEDGKIIVEGKKKEEEATDDECKCVYHGIKGSNFKTIIPVANKFDLTRAEAEMKNGMLSILIPLAEDRKPRDITIRIGSPKRESLEDKT